MEGSVLQPTSSSFIERVLGVMRLESGIYEEIEHDQDATWQAAVVVAAAAIFSGIGSSNGRAGLVVGGAVVGLLFWALYAGFAYAVGAYILQAPETSATFGEVLRALGFAYAPTALGVFALVPEIGAFIVVAGFLWWLIASVIALRQSLEVSTARAVAIGVAAFVAMIVVMVLLVTILGIGFASLDIVLAP